MKDALGRADLTRETWDRSFEKGFLPLQRADVKSRSVEGEMVVLDQGGGLVHQFNQTATCIWERCNGQYTPAEIAAELCELFDVDQETALKDVLESIRQLQELKLLQSHPIPLSNE